MRVVRTLATIFIPLALGVGAGALYERSAGDEPTDAPASAPPDEEHGVDPEQKPDSDDVHRNAIIIGAIVFLGSLAGATGLEKKKPEDRAKDAPPPRKFDL